MVGPLLTSTSWCCDKLKPEDARENKAIAAVIAADAVIAISCLVMGILGLTSVVGMPVAAAFAMVGVSIAVFTPYILAGIFLLSSYITEKG